MKNIFALLFKKKIQRGCRFIPCPIGLMCSVNQTKRNKVKVNAPGEGKLKIHEKVLITRWISTEFSRVECNRYRETVSHECII